MHKAIQELKTLTKSLVLVGFLLLAAAIGLDGLNQNDRTTSSGSEEPVVQEPQVTQIQKQPKVSDVVKSESRKQYIVQSGDSYWVIANKLKPRNVEVGSYINVLIEVNNGAPLHENVPINVPNDDELIHITLPDVKLNFSIIDAEIIQHIKEAEGTSTAQSNNKRRLLGGQTGPSYRNSKFYPYKDIKGNYTIGYGHFIGKKEADARKFRNGITKKEAHELLMKDVQRVHDDLILLLQRKNAINLTPSQERVLFELAFTMGVDKLATFNKMWKSVEHGNEKKFKKEIKNSLWYKQVGNRADLLLSYL